MEFKATVKGVNIAANTFSDLKRKASIVANGYFDVIDNMTVYLKDGKTLLFTRFNRKSPNNCIVRGQWK